MRIAYLIHSLHNRGGMERVLGLKAGMLAATPGYEVYIITAHQKGRPDAFPLDPLVKRVDLGISDRFFLAAYRKALEKCLGEIRPDITVSLCGNDLYVLPDLRDGSRKVAESHFPYDKFILKYGRNPVSVFRTHRLEKAVAAMDAFVVLTKGDAKRWSAAVPGVRQIYNPLTFHSESRSPLTGKRAVCIGRLSPEKNFADAIRAWKLLMQTHADWTLDLFGGGAERPALERLIREEGLEGSVRLRGVSSQIKEELLGSSFLLMSSRYEGFPMTLLEAAACGVPMISYDCPSGPSEIIRDGVNGFLVPCGNVAALADACRRMIEGPLDQMGAAARLTAESFRPEAIIAQWRELFTSLLR